jgi:ATP-dependent RNA helicase DDX51/DBP6
MAPAAPVVLSALASDKDDVRAITQGGSVSAADLGLSPQVVESLANSLGITTLFSMQAAVVSHLTCVPDRDVVLCAPTGSGKTLAYALPIVSALSSRVVPRLRAVVIVPTRDLAAQVHRVFAALVSTGPGTPGPDLSVAVAVGASSVSREAPAVCAADILIATPGRLVEHTKNTPSFSLQFVSFLILDESDRLLQDSYYGWADVVVPACGKEVLLPGAAATKTPRTPAGLAALFIHPVTAGIGAVSTRAMRRRPRMILASATQTRNPKRLVLLDLQRPVYFVTGSGDNTGAGGVEGRGSDADGGHPEAGSAATAVAADCDGSGDRGVNVVTKKTDSMPLSHGVTTFDRYHVPESLIERAYVVNHPSDKPVALAKLLGLMQPSDTDISRAQAQASQGRQATFVDQEVQGAVKPAGIGVLKAVPAGGATLVFTKSVEAAHRLARLLELFASCSRADMTVLEISGDLPAERRRYVVSAVQASVKGTQETSTVVVCSDVLARGMDISSVDVVVNYDVPVHVNTYLHRVGRTARAGRTGLAITLILAKQARHCKAMVRSIDRGSATMKFRSIVRADEHFDAMLPSVEAALSGLKRVLRREQLGLIAVDECLPDHTLTELRQLIVTAANDDETPRAHKRRRPENAYGLDSRWTPGHDGGDDAGEDEHGISVDVVGRGATDGVDEDDFSDLLRAQVARNFLSRRTVSQH